MRVSGELKEEDARLVRSGHAAEVRLDAYPDKKYTAEVLSVSQFARRKDVQQSGKIFDLRLRLQETDKAVMRPGMRAKLAVTIEKVRDVVTIPVEAVFDDKGRSVVYVKKGLRAETREVRTGRRNDTHIAILDGLAPGEEVYCERPDIS
jgi:multidrug efflux pump subunit AcrA (membrane-fusion protein)